MNYSKIHLLLQSFLSFALKTANNGMIQNRYEPISRHVKSVRSQLDAVLFQITEDVFWAG